jgi:hypothetical protein
MASFKLEKPFGVSIFEDLIIGVDLIFVLFFGFMVTCLSFFHSYLATVNQTTWECASWSKISYLKQWPRRLGSPFSRGLVQNLKYFVCGKHKVEPTVWEVPSELPDKTPRLC